MLHSTDPPSEDSPASRSKDFRVALSFSGKRREMAEKVASFQIKHFGKSAVFIDQNFLEDMGRPNLNRFLQNVFGDRSDLVVVLSSEGYATGHWCRTEWRVILDLINQGREQIMLLRLDDSALPDGALSIDHFLDVSGMDALDISNLIIKRYNRGATNGNGAVSHAGPGGTKKEDVPLSVVTLKLPININEFDNGKKAILLDTITAMARTLSEAEGLEVVVREPGCVVVTLQMRENLALEVCHAAREGHVGQFPVIFWRVDEPSERIVRQLGQTFGWNTPGQRNGGFWGPVKSWHDLLDRAVEVITNPFVLINVVSKRVRQLNGGRSPLIPTRPSMGAAQIALTELIEGKIRIASCTPCESYG